MKFLCCARFFFPILASMSSEEDMYFQQQLAICFKFCADMMVYLTKLNVCPLFLYYEDNMANDVVFLPKISKCFMYFVRNYCTPSTIRYALTKPNWEWNYYVVVF